MKKKFLNRPEVILIRATPDEKKQIVSAAARDRRTVSNFILWVMDRFIRGTIR